MDTQDERYGGDAPCPSLSILIPTYNRPTCLNFLLARLLTQIDREQLGTLIEIVVSDNCSPQAIDAMLDAHRERGLSIRYIRPPRHFESAEENLFFGLNACRGTFVWPIGDDDILVEGAVTNIKALIRSEKVDFILLNSVQINTSGEIIESKQGKLEKDLTSINIRDLAQLFGLTTILASFSSVVFRREPMISIDIDRYLRSSPIYSHVATYMEAFADKAVMFVAEPQVMLREGTTLDAFRIFATARREAIYAPWIKGLFRLRDHLLARELIDGDFLLHTLEVDKIGRFRTFARLLVVLGQQLELWLDDLMAGRPTMEHISAEDFATFRDALAGAPQWALEVLLVFEETRQAAEAASMLESGGAADQIAGLAKLRERLLSTRWFDDKVRITAWTVPDRMETLNGYQVGRFGKDHFAVPVGLPLPNQAIIDFTRHDLGPPDPRVIVRPSAEAIRTAISRRSRKAVPQTIGDYWLFEQADRIFAVHADLRLRWGGEIDFACLAAEALPPLSLAAPTMELLLPQIRIYGRPRAVREGDFAARLDWLVTPEWYRQRHPDLEQVANDPVTACVRHIKEHEAEDPCPTPLIDLAIYQNSLARFGRAIGDSSVGLLRSLVMEGFANGLNFSPLFDERWYCTTYSDAAAMVVEGRISCGFEHYLTIGRAHRTNPGPYFDEAFYLARYADAAEACASGHARTGAEHFLWHGTDMGFSPNPNFDEQSYLEVNGDVASAVAAGHVRSGFLHWLSDGRLEGRSINRAGEISGTRVQPAYAI